MAQEEGGATAVELTTELDLIEPLPRFDLDGAERRAKTALAAARGLDRPDLVLRAQLVQADVLERRGSPAASGRIAREVNLWATDNAHRYLLARSHYVLEAVFQDLGDASLALEHAVRAVDLLDEGALPAIRFDHLVRLADCFARSGPAESARERYPQVLRLAEELGDVDRQLLVLNNRAYFESLDGQFAEALAYSNRMQALASSVGVTLHVGRLETIARALIGLGRLEEAERVMVPALRPEVLRAAPDGDAGADSLLTLAEIQRLLGKTAAAQATLDECVRLCESNGLTAIAVRAMQEQAELHAAAGRFAAAYELHKAFHQEVMAQQSGQRDARARAMQAMFETSEARQASQRYRELSLRDPLTGLYNRRYVDETLPEMLRRTATEPYAEITVALVDLDRFKRINDTYSHSVGDKVLAAMAKLLESAVVRLGADMPFDAFAARMGGEEFLLVFAAADAQTATRLLEEFCEAVRSHAWSELTGALPVTVSIGATNATTSDQVTADLLIRADRHLYTAKKTGRDRVVSDVGDVSGPLG